MDRRFFNKQKDKSKDQGLGTSRNTCFFMSTSMSTYFINVLE